MLYHESAMYCADEYGARYQSSKEITAEDLLFDRVEHICQKYPRRKQVPESLWDDFRQEVWIAVLTKVTNVYKYLEAWLDDERKWLQPRMYSIDELHRRAMATRNTSEKHSYNRGLKDDRAKDEDLRDSKEHLFNDWRENQPRPRARWRKEDIQREKNIAKIFGYDVDAWVKFRKKQGRRKYINPKSSQRYYFRPRDAAEIAYQKARDTQWQIDWEIHHRKKMKQRINAVIIEWYPVSYGPPYVPEPVDIVAAKHDEKCPWCGAILEYMTPNSRKKPRRGILLHCEKGKYFKAQCLCGFVAVL